MKFDINVPYEKLGKIPLNFITFFETKDDKNLELSNNSYSEVFLIKIGDGEKKDINFNIEDTNSVIKVILLIGENCVVKDDRRTLDGPYRGDGISA